MMRKFVNISIYYEIILFHTVKRDR